MEKVKRNNFVRAAEGEPDIECVCLRDTDLSRMYFEENFKMLQHSGYRSTSVAYYIDNGNVEAPSSFPFMIKGTKEDKISYLVNECNYEDAAEWTENDMNTEILYREEDVNLINYALDKMPAAPKGLEFVPTKNLIIISTNGYSQGDYAVVIYCPEDLEKAWGNYPKQENIQKMVNHYFWDAPIYCRFEIDGKEYDYEEDPYDFERDKFIERIAKESGIDKEKLKSFVPEYPEYA